MAGPEDWGAVPAAESPEAWGAVPAGEEPSRRRDISPGRVMAENLDVPQAFSDRFGLGNAIIKAADEKARSNLDKLLGLGGERYQLWPERMVRSGATLAADVITGKVITGPGLRKEDFSDDPDAPEPLDELIQRATDMAAGQLAMTTIPRVLPRMPLVNAGEGRVARLYSEPDGTMRSQVIGQMPIGEDFKIAAEALAPEAISAAAVRVKGQIFTGPIHVDALNTAAKALDEPYRTPAEIGYFNHQAESGFVTSKGRFVNREEAAEIAGRGGTDNFGRPKELLAQDIEDHLRALWEERGIHPAEAVHDTGQDAFLKRELTTPERDPAVKLPPEAWTPENLAERPYELPAEAAETPLRAVGADVTSAPSLAQQPAPPPGRLSAAAHDAATTLFDMGRDIQMMVAPMATGTTESMAIAKDFMNSTRKNLWEWSRIDTDLEKRFTPEQRARMWNAMDEESVALQRGEPREHQGLATLTPEERAAVVDLDTRQQIAWLRAKDMGMVEGEGLPMHATRIVTNIAEATSKDHALSLDAIGRNLTVKTPFMRHRAHLTVEETEAAAKAKFGPEAVVARDIRAVALSTAKLEDAISGRTLVDAIKDYGKRTGSEAVAEGGVPAGSEFKWFTIDHPALKTWRPKFETDPVTGKTVAALDDKGNAIFQQVPIYIRSDFEGPLRASLTRGSSQVYGAMMSLKGKTMGLIMNSPMIHNAVEWGRALPAMPGKVATFKVYFEGNRAKNDVATMREAIDGGLVPIGKRFFNQDIDAIMEAPNLTPGRSWTSQVLAFVPGLFDEAAGTAVKRAIDKAGDFWHNTMLWDRVADLQMGLYVNLRDELVGKGVDRQTASRTAAHWANRYAGALPQEAMSDSARKVANMLLFSRSFTLGNLGVMKDMLTGLPKDVLAQMERDAGFRVGAIGEAGEVAGVPQAVQYAKTMARRKAMAIVALDMGLMYIGNSLLQNISNVLRTDSTLDKELHGYAERLSKALADTKEHPARFLFPIPLVSGTMKFAQQLSATHENEPDRQERLLVGQTKDGTAIYARNPAGKIGEEFQGYLTGPLDMIRKKLGTIARPAWQIMANDRGFGRKVYDPNADTPAKYLQNMGAIVAHLVKSQFPEGQITAAHDLVKGEGDPKLAALQAFGPIAGVTFSKGAPGGPAVGELYAARSQHQFAVDAALPDIRKQIQRGDLAGAYARMTELGIPPGLQKFYVRTSVNPATRFGGRTLKDFYLYATPEQRQRLERAR